MIKKNRNLFLGVLTFAILTTGGIKLIKTKNKMKIHINSKTVAEHVKKNENHNANIVAHRGFSSIYNDNTYEAIKEAMDSPCVDMVETDVRITKDGVMILYHNAEVILPYGIHCINNLLYEEVKNYYFKDYLLGSSVSTHNMMTIKDLKRIYNYTKPIILDIKFLMNNDELIKYCFKEFLNYEQYFYIQSSDYNSLINMQRLYPNFHYIYIIDSIRDLNRENDLFDGYCVKNNFINRIKIDKDKMYLVWLINSIEDYNQLINKNNYKDNMYIITDNPNLICILDEKSKSYKKEY